MYPSRPPSEREVEEFKAWQRSWGGRVFRCKSTGETLTIPPSVHQTDFFSFGDCYVDVGRVNSYSRFGGEMEELTKYE